MKTVSKTGSDPIRRVPSGGPFRAPPGETSGGGRCFLLRADDELAEGRGCEQPRNVGDLHRAPEAVGRNLGQVALQLRETLVGDDAFVLELDIGQVAARVLDDLATRDLDLERTLEPEHHV